MQADPGVAVGVQAFLSAFVHLQVIVPDNRCRCVDQAVVDQGPFQQEVRCIDQTKGPAFHQRAVSGARNHLVDLERLSDQELQKLQSEFERIGAKAEEAKVRVSEVKEELKSR